MTILTYVFIVQFTLFSLSFWLCFDQGFLERFEGGRNTTTIWAEVRVSGAGVSSVTCSFYLKYIAQV